VDRSTEAAQHLEQTKLLLDQLSAALRKRRVPNRLTLEQHAALVQAEVALETYVDFFYPHEPHQ
jgi:hypothetical protein